MFSYNHTNQAPATNQSLLGKPANAQNNKNANRTALRDVSNVNPKQTTGIKQHFLQKKARQLPQGSAVGAKNLTTIKQVVEKTQIAQKVTETKTVTVPILEQTRTEVTQTSQIETTTTSIELTANVTKAEPEEPTPAQIEEWLKEDPDDKRDIIMVSEYAPEILSYLRQLETQNRPNPEYMDHQDEIVWRMRSILVDWMIEMHSGFSMHPETLHLAINVVDRFLAKRLVGRNKLQLVGITALCIACKFEEVSVPGIEEFLDAADRGYTRDEMLKAERYMIGTIDWNLSVPTPLTFMRHINSKAETNDVQIRTVCKYLIEICLIDEYFLHYVASQIACATTWLARKMINKEFVWNSKLIYFSGYTESDLRPLALRMVKFLNGPVSYNSSYHKFSHKRLLRVSLFVRSWLDKEIAL